MDFALYGFVSSIVIVLFQSYVTSVYAKNARRTDKHERSIQDLYKRTEEDGNRLTKLETEIENLKTLCERNHRD